MKREIDLQVNGESYSIVVDTRETLLDALRYRLGFMGPKEGCGNGNCGSCTVSLNGMVADSCLVFAVEADGAEVTTVEGVAVGGKLHPVQQAFIENGGLQCGFCTPGFIMSAKALLEQNPNPTEQEIRLALSGNLCRCTGYDKIVRAVTAASQALSKVA
ncbi:MAG TPA: (2Fe-2S)-binding protein [Candidatus Binatia bacterium]|nr:(2Fe-2S)-binding protein [Candidatus Binatia bacterium]